MSQLQTAFPDGAKFRRDDEGELLIAWADDEQFLSDWINENTVSGTAYETIEAVSGEIVAVVLQLPTGGTSNGLSVGRRFILVRHEDVSQVSGTGVVAQGIQWPDGTVSMRWCNPGLPSSFACWDSIEAIERIHGHGGKTEIEWID